MSSKRKSNEPYGIEDRKTITDLENFISDHIYRSSQSFLPLSIKNENKKKKILIIDDDPNMIKMGKETIVSGGYEVFSAEQGRKGLELILEHKPELIILNYKLPDISGMEVFKQLITSQKYEHPLEIPVIMLTEVNVNGTDRTILFELGLAAFLTKPFGYRELLNVIDNVFISSLIRQKNKALAQKLKRTEYKYQDLIENANDLIFTLNLKGDLIFINRRLNSLAAFAREDWIGKSFFDLIVPEDRIEARNNFHLAIKGKARIFEIRMNNMTNSPLFLTMNINPIFEKREIVGVVGIARDITQRKKLEQALKDIKEFNESIIQSMGAGLITLDMENRITSFNKGAEEVLGYKNYEVMGKFLKEILQLDESKKLLSDIVSLDKPLSNQEIELTRKDGTKVLIGYAIAPRIDNQNLKVGTIISFRDITDFKKMLIEIADMKKSTEMIQPPRYFSEFSLSQNEPYPGQTIGNRYEIIRVFNYGQESIIYLAQDKNKEFGNKENLVVIKWYLSKTKEHIKRWQEGHALSKLYNIPGLCKIYDIVKLEGKELINFVVLEYLEGINLSEDIEIAPAKPNKYEIKDIASKFLDIIWALVLMHEKANIVHRDIKPSNIMKSPDGTLTIIDVGIVKERKTEMTLTLHSQAIGSPPYMAPEALFSREHLNFDKCDIYSVGATLYETLTRAKVFSGSIGEIARDKLNFENYQKALIPPHKLNPEIVYSLSSIIMKCLEYYPINRYPSVKSLYEDLKDWFEGKSIQFTKAKTSKNPKVFISYVSEDEKSVECIVKKLIENEINVWFDKYEVEFGDDFQSKMEIGFKQSDFVLAFCTKNFIEKNGWQKEEIRWATIAEKKKKISKLIPIIIEPCKIEGLLEIKVYCDLSQTEKFSENFNRLLEQLKKATKIEEDIVE